MPVPPQLMHTRHGKLVPNPAAGATAAHGKPTVKPLSWYGNAEHILFVLEFYKRDRRRKVYTPNRYSRAVQALATKFSVTESTAKKAIAALAAYRADVFAVEAPHEIVELVDDFKRIAAKAEAAGDWNAAIAARREVCKLTNAYAPVRVDVTHHEGGEAPTTVDQIRAMFKVLTPESQLAIERALGEMEQARADGRLRLITGDEVIDAEAIEKAG